MTSSKNFVAVFATVVGLAVLMAIGGVIAAANALGSTALFAYLLAGILLLALVFIMIATVLNNLGLSSHEYALGLPRGSIRAVLAVVLTVIFAGLSVYLMGELDDAKTVVSGLKSKPASPGEGFVVREITDGTETTWSIVSLKPAEATVELAKQIFTTVATVLVMVIGFYFGNRSTEASVVGDLPPARQAIKDGKLASTALSEAAAVVDKAANALDKLKKSTKIPADLKAMLLAAYTTSLNDVKAELSKCEAEAETCRVLAERVGQENDPATQLQLAQKASTARRTAKNFSQSTIKGANQIVDELAEYLAAATS